MSFDYTTHDATALAALVRSGEVSPEELLAACQERVQAHNPRLNAVIVETFDQAREELALRRRAGTEREGALAGVPVLVKDLLSSVRGVTVWNGNRLLQRITPPADHDSAFIGRLRATGAVIVGKTSTPEFGLVPYTEPELTGPTRNPWDLTRTPGGSSGGSGAAVAARLVPLATGGDGGGSIRIPAACCGLVGLKPRAGACPPGRISARCGTALRSSML
ncbi:MAG: amidase [Rubrivivax sp.]